MNMIVCVKKVPDPEIPPAKFKIDSAAKRVIPPEGIPPVMNPFDERAVELALRAKQKYGGIVTVLTVGNPEAGDIVKRAIAMGANEGIILSDPAFEGSDSFGVASILSAAIAKIGGYDVVLCGREASDWDEGLVGPLVAGSLGIPVVTLAVDIEQEESSLRIKRITLDGHQVFSMPRPVLVTVSQEVGRPRLPSGSGIIMAARKKLPVWGAADIGVDPALVGGKAAGRKLVRLSPAERARRCEIIEAEAPDEAGRRLAERLREVGAV